MSQREIASRRATLASSPPLEPALPDIPKVVAEVEAIDETLARLADIAEDSVRQLRSESNLTSSIAIGLQEGEAFLQEVLASVEGQRHRVNELKAAVKRKQVLAVTTFTHSINEIEKEITSLRGENTKLDYDIIAADAEIARLKQELSSVSVVVAEDGADDNFPAEAASESEHAMLRHNALFDAITKVPTLVAVTNFMERMARDIAPSDSRDIRALLAKSSSEGIV